MGDVSNAEAKLNSEKALVNKKVCIAGLVSEKYV